MGGSGGFEEAPEDAQACQLVCQSCPLSCQLIPADHDIGLSEERQIVHSTNGLDDF